MKRFNNILFVILIFTVNSFADNWEKQQTPVLSLLYSLDFTDSLNGWAAGEDGTIIHTSNGGINWIQQSSSVFYTIYSIDFINQSTGWAVAVGGFQTGTAIMKTTNAGVNWSFYTYPDSNQFFYKILFDDASTGWMGGYNGVKVKSTNGGANWFPTQNDSNPASTYPVNNINFYNKNYGFACGGIYDLAGVIWKTTNGGLFWSTYVVSSEPLNDIYYFDSSNVILTGGDFEIGAQIIKTTNAGVDWEYVPLNAFGIARAISFRTPSEGWIVLGFSAHFMVSTNSGINWSLINATENSELYDIQFVNQRNGWSCGKNGVILKYNSNTIGINNNPEEIPISFKLFQNFPNPFNPVTKISFEIPVKGEVKLKIYDVLGNLVYTLVNGNLDAGKHNYDFSGEDLSSGVYYYTIEAGSFKETKKMMLIK
jgi:photosystem II stability/assembly factor-like uncharacterized protein